MISTRKIPDLLFLDIETVPQTADFSQLSEHGQELWSKKARTIRRHAQNLSELDDAAIFKERAGIYAEFGKVICITIGYFRSKKFKKLRLKSFYGHNEKELLSEVAELIRSYFNDSKKNIFCGHNIREFDMPYLCRRMMHHNIKIPKIMSLSGKKPWQVSQILDTLELWKFGDYKNYTSLDTIAYTLGIPSPKSDMDGSMVAKAYYEEDRLDDIEIYCRKDVVTLARVLLRMHRITDDFEEVVVD